MPPAFLTATIGYRLLPEPIIVSRYKMMWTANSVRRVTLEPGDVTVREVHLQPHKTGAGAKKRPDIEVYDGYTGFPALPPSSVSHVFRMRAVFETRQ